MAIRKRNLLCIKKKENLDLGHILLYEPYKNILSNFVDLATNPKAIEFDPVSRAFSGLESVSEDIKHYYESLLGVTSYFQASKGGRGRYIEKKISSVVETCSLDIKLSELPIWFTHPDLHRKKGIFAISGLSNEEKSRLRRIDWDWIGDNDEKTDLGNLLRDESRIVLVELKNRVDSGGTAARREIWTKKFRTILELLSGTNKKLYRKENQQFSLIELLNYFGIRNTEIYIGILFNVDGSPASKQGDREQGFYSSNDEGYRDLKRHITSLSNIVVKEGDVEHLSIIIGIEGFEGISIKVGSLYGNEVAKALFRREYPISDILILRYDDIWLSQLTVISERTILLKFSKNYMTILRDVIRRDRNVRKLYDEFITSEGAEGSLNKLVDWLSKNCQNDFPDRLYPSEKLKDEYLADVIQVLAACEA